MKNSKADLLLHPIRLRIIQTLLGGKRLTAQEMMEYLPEVPQASLYRHLKKLEEAGLVDIADKRKVRGTIEKVYSLPNEANELTKEELQSMSREEHMKVFMNFIANIVADFEKYLQQEKTDFVKDGAGYRQVSFYASDEEFSHFIRTISKEMKILMNQQPSPERKKRILTTIVVPAGEQN